MACVMRERCTGLDWPEGQRVRQIGVHRLVLDAWEGPCPVGYEIDHNDGVKTHNRRENLRYVTHRENIQLAHADGRFPDMSVRASALYGTSASPETRAKQSAAKLGARHPRAVRPDVERILLLRQMGKSDGLIAAELGMKRTVVGDVLRGTHWSVRTEYVARNAPRVNPNAVA
jgi:hypothetical protein